MKTSNDSNGCRPVKGPAQGNALRQNRRVRGQRSFHGRRRNVLDVAHGYRAALPCRENLSHALMNQAVPLRHLLATPTQHEIQLNQSSLQIGTVVAFKRRYLAREADSISADRLPQLIDT